MVTVVGGASAFAGYVTSQQVRAILTTTGVGATLAEIAPLRALGASRALAGAAGGIVAGVVMAYGMFLLGQSDLRTANRMALAGGVGAGAGLAFEVGTFALVAHFGTASTGTAIATLSGAAATKATLAAIGGSVAGGTAVLTGGAAILGVVAYAGFMGIMRMIDKENARELIRWRLEVVGAGLSARTA